MTKVKATAPLGAMKSTQNIAEAIRERHQEIGRFEAEIVRLRGEIAKLLDAARLMGAQIMQFEDDGEEPPSPVAGDITEAARKYGDVKAAIRSAIEMVPPDRFSVNDVTGLVSAVVPGFNLETGKANISAYLKEFSEGRGAIIELIEPGRGRTPAYYRVKK